MAREGFVYFVREGEKGPIKIGSTCDLKHRLSTLQSGNPNRLYLIGSIASSTPEALERELHRRFGRDRISGEWFAPTIDLLQLAFRQENCESAYFEDGEQAT